MYLGQFTHNLRTIRTRWFAEESGLLWKWLANEPFKLVPFSIHTHTSLLSWLVLFGWLCFAAIFIFISRCSTTLAPQHHWGCPQGRTELQNGAVIIIIWCWMLGAFFLMHWEMKNESFHFQWGFDSLRIFPRFLLAWSGLLLGPYRIRTLHFYPIFQEHNGCTLIECRSRLTSPKNLSTCNTTYPPVRHDLAACASSSLRMVVHVKKCYNIAIKKINATKYWTREVFHGKARMTMDEIQHP